MKSKTSLQNLRRLIDIMALLRSENGCEWDREQTPDSLKKHILEEAYELLEAIDGGNPDDICDELGDLLLQVVFQAQIFSENDHFNIEDVAGSINDKLIRRHPHIFSDASHEDHEIRWEKIKQQERFARGQSESLAKRIPSSLPALKRASKVLKKIDDVPFKKSIEQMQGHLKQLSCQPQGKDGCSQIIEQQVANLLFSICRIAISSNIDPEDLLRKKTTQLISEIDETKELY